MQSLLLGLVAVVLYLEEKDMTLLGIAFLTLLSKVIIVDWVMKKIHTRMKIKRDVEFHYLSPVSSILLGIFLVIMVYYAFSPLQTLTTSQLSFLGAVVGISLTLMGMLVIFSRKKAITKIIGYLTMENGVVLFSLFLTELPFMIEILILIDLVMLVLMATILAFGMDSTIEEFHQRLHRLTSLGGEEP